MNKEQAAREFFVRDSENINKYTSGYCFISGWDAGQKQLLDEAASGFEEWWSKEREMPPPGDDYVFVSEKYIYRWESEAWQAAKLSSAAELERVKRERDEAVCDCGTFDKELMAMQFLAKLAENK